MKKWYFVIICFILLCCLNGCNEPKQTTQPGEFGHLIYKHTSGSIVEWEVIGMYVNDSLIVIGNPRTPNYKHPIINRNNGKIVDYYLISEK